MAGGIVKFTYEATIKFQGSVSDELVKELEKNARPQMQRVLRRLITRFHPGIVITIDNTPGQSAGT